MITITLDTSCLDPDYPELDDLASLKIKGKIKLYAEISTEIEKEKWENEDKKNKILQWMKSYTQPYLTAREVPAGKTIFDMLPWTEKEERDVFRKVVEIHSPEFKNLKDLDKLKPEKYLSKLTDWKLCTRHILLKRDFFVTKDESGFTKGGRKEKFEKTFGIKIRLLNQDFINELKEIIGG